MKIPSVAGLTDVGTVRAANQDAIDWRISDDHRQILLVVADGMGGYQGGEIASRIAVDTVMETLGAHFESGNGGLCDARPDAIQVAINLASERIQERRAADPDLAKMGTTLVVSWVIDGEALIAHLGDSRCYLVHKGELQCLTRDDTVVQNMLEDGSIQPDDVPHVPFRNVLTRALGASSALASFGRVVMESGDCLLLCSDGLIDGLPEADWLPLMSAQKSADEQVRALVQASLDNEAADNVSVVILILD
ncbi:serine/threonine-protein phosphatase [Marinobacter vulgaris]|uniref:Serine/threonine-protein phosphatase n=1 Tax=Marinobacter vulgaris TaxID=1928331 RepID=A0A2V3ZLQ6_9GAMM|nr:protein phosphatase 2C domain-containing protein [Marinobacter vulgaris]PXX90385.1 serine/threonine-protein phosphatase [Marinobacter vulgaris]TSJ69588.1 serine/threonine-protein phosphatase [Marinobacter vulgaris]